MGLADLKSLEPDHCVAVIELQPGEFEISTGNTLRSLFKSGIVDVNRLLVQANNEHSVVSGIRPIRQLASAHEYNARPSKSQVVKQLMILPIKGCR